MKKPWGGRFTGKTSSEVEAFTESISFDSRLWKYDIQGSIAHAKMLGKQGIIPKKDATKIVTGLRAIAREMEAGTFPFSVELEDIHMNIEAALAGKIGEAGKRLHTARSRNDQVALDLRLYLREETRAIIKLIENLQRALLRTAERNMDAVMPGYTHLQRAQPVLLSHYMLAYVEMFGRDASRFEDSLRRLNVLPLGACALSGTSLPTDRAYVAHLLGFDSVSENSIDSVSDRDFALEFLGCCSIAAVHLSRLAEELVLWSTEEFGFIEISDEYTTGSSIMPQKKNPDVAELIRGKTGRVYGNLISLLTIMKGLPLAYNRDMQEDKLPVFDTVDTIKASLSVAASMLPGIKFRTGRMKDTSGKGFSTATDLAEYLVRKGVPFREAHEITGKIVRYCINGNKELSNLSIEEFRNFSSVVGKDVFAVLDPSESVKAKASFGGTAPSEVKRRIKSLRKLLGA